MQRLGAAIAAVIGWMWCGTAAADVSGASIAGYCTSSGAFGERFGAAAVNNRQSRSFRLFNAQYVELPSSPPFTEAEVVFTDDSRRLHSITGFATFASEAEAATAYAAAVSAFAQDPRFVPQPTGDEQTAAFYSADPETRSGFRAELTVSGDTLMLACADTALSQSARNEWTSNFGLGPTASAAPALPQAWDAAAIAQEHCTTEGAFGQQFGQRLRGRSRSGLTEHNRVLTSRASYPPFQDFEATITPRTRVVQSITARATFADARQAFATYTALVAAYEATGRLPYRSEDRLIAGPAGIVFASDESSLVGYSVFVGLEGREVRLVCSNSALLSQAFDEAFGRTN